MNLEQLKQDIQDFEKFKEDLDRQQLTFPLDKESISVMAEKLMFPTGNNTLAGLVGPTSDSQEIIVNGKKYFVQLAS